MAALTLASAGIAVAMPTVATAASCADSWTAAVDQSWFIPGNWSPDGQDVCIGNVATGTNTIDVNGGSAVVGALTLGGSSGIQTLALNSTSLLLGADSTLMNAGVITLGVSRRRRSNCRRSRWRTRGRSACCPAILVTSTTGPW